MGWGIRLSIFGVAFVTGVLVSSFLTPAVLAPGESIGTAELSHATGAWLVVSCVDGNPSIQEVKGTDGAVQVKCAKSEMRVVRSRPAPPIRHDLGPISAPIAAALSTGK